MKKMTFKTSESCPMKCLGCYDEEKNGQRLSAEENIRFARILRQIGYSAITLGGGDPLERSDIGQIIEEIDELGFDIHLDTTGKQFLEKEYDETLSAKDVSDHVDLIGIPLDGGKDEAIKKFRGGKASTLEETKEILKKLDETGCNISINTVVHRGNLDELNDIYKVIREYNGVKRWELHQFAVISGNSVINRDRFEITNEEFFKAVEEIESDDKITINAKISEKKLNFAYLDYNGDVVELRNGEKFVLFNIAGLPDEEVADQISVSNIGN